jgi:hypothetical protein
MSEHEIHDWVDHSPDNLWVLCDVHHRHRYLGIHEISYPIWAPQDLLRPDFEDYVRQQVAADAPRSPARAQVPAHTKARPAGRAAPRARAGSAAGSPAARSSAHRRG